MLLRALIFGLALAASGCTQVQLARSTINQGNTLADMQRRQVLDNLAMFRADPDALAWHLKLRGGLVQVADQGSVSILGVLFNDASMSPSGGFQRGVVGQWDVEPAVDVDELESLQLAYRLAVNPQDAQARREIYKTIGETAVSHHIVLSESALEKLIAALVADPAEREAYHARNRMLRMELRNQASIIEQLRASGAPQVDSAFRSPNGAFSDQGIERLKAMLDSRVLTADTAQAWVMLTTEARVLTEDNVIKLTQEVCGAEMHFVPRYPIDGRRERNVALDDQAEEKIDKLFELLEEEQFQRPWLFFGKKCDVPRDACDVGRYGRCYVWTSPQTRRTLTDFVLIVLALVPSNEQDISGGGAPGGGGGVAYSPTLANGS